ncbi:MAG: penicillin-binding protein [Chloroflexi bacterium]|nr:MAG: penicillin-binding protein [Chloroflexota bacterium]
MKRLIIVLVAMILAGLALGYRLFIADLPSPDALLTRSSPDTTKIYDRHGRLLFEVLDPRAGRRTRVPLDELPLHVRQAVIAVEDVSFYENPGIDLRGITRAAFQMLRERRIVSGGSTITQQLARAVLLSQEERSQRTFTRKLRESILALRITRAFSKDQILEMYLNEVYFGQLAYGIEAAAQTYFGKPARELDLAEAALLAGLIQSPAAYNPLVNIDAARRRQAVALDLMVKAGFVTPEEAELAKGEPLHFTGGNVPLRAPHFVTYVRNLLEARYGAEQVNHGGLRVITTLDLDLQTQAEAIIRRRIAELNEHKPGKPDYNVSDAALVALDPHTGEILAMVGSADYFNEKIDGAVNVALARRQPGSAIKPITYAAAFERCRADSGYWVLGIGGSTRYPISNTQYPMSSTQSPCFTPATVLSDVPTTFLTKENEPYRPMNYDRMWHGPISLRRALATSSNMIAVKVLDAVGVDAMIDTAEALGITTLTDRDRYGLALTLGGGEVKLLELTAAYAAFANAGYRVTPTAILSVTASTGSSSRNNRESAIRNTRYAIPDAEFASSSSRLTAQPSPGPAISPQVAYLITDILSDDEARLPAFGENSVLKLTRPAAAKTGTTSDWRDNWTIGYTPDLAVGVWVGNADNSPMRFISGITGAGPIWHDFMEEALKGKPARDFLRPDGLVEVEICESSGLLPTEHCRRRKRELFIKGTEPTAYDTSYQALEIDAATGLLWEEGCQGPKVEHVFRVLPPEARDWGRKAGIPQPPTTTCLGQTVNTQYPSPNTQYPISNPQSTGQGGSLQLAVVNPAPNTTFALSAQLPAEFQRVEVMAQARTTTPLRQVTLLVDGRPLATLDRPPYRALWQLEAGMHQVRAVGVTLDGRQVESEAVRFKVLEEEPRREAFKPTS